MVFEREKFGNHSLLLLSLKLIFKSVIFTFKLDYRDNRLCPALFTLKVYNTFMQYNKYNQYNTTQYNAVWYNTIFIPHKVQSKTNSYLLKICSS